MTLQNYCQLTRSISILYIVRIWLLAVDTVEALTDTGGDITDRDVTGEMMIGPQNQDSAAETIEVRMNFILISITHS